jgi:ABC-type nitrate/sulfonate/bicarbonate transport system permease component
VSTTATLAKHRGFPLALGLGSFLLVIALVEVLIRVGLINRFIVPMPSEIIMAFPRIVLEEHVLTRFLDTAVEAFSASVLVTVFGIGAACCSISSACCAWPPRPGSRPSRRHRWC